MGDFVLFFGRRLAEALLKIVRKEQTVVAEPPFARLFLEDAPKGMPFRRRSAAVGKDEGCGAREPCTAVLLPLQIAKEKGAVFLMQIGGALASGEPHDGRAPDYDDWSLNGDIIVYYPVLDTALELSSMGIRVDEEALIKQLEIAGCPERAQLPFQKAIIEKQLPYTIGGGIGQSRICMFFLRKAHIGEVQVSIWPEDTVEYAKSRGVTIL